MAWVFDKRERMANQLLMRGHATMDEILEASFGEWPPKGLDIVGRNSQHVPLLPISQVPDDLNKRYPSRSDKLYDRFAVGARGATGGERKIGINKLLCCTLPSLLGKSTLNSALGHEATHILQGDHNERTNDTFGANYGWEMYHGKLEAATDYAVDHLFIEHKDTNPKKKSVTWLETPADISYYTQGIEIQARIHQLLIRGYPKWGRLPQNHEELWTALADGGLKPPQMITDYLEKSPAIEEIRKVFSNKLGGRNGEENVGLKIAQNALTEAGVVEFWGKTLPALYVDLIEMYGDRLGRERFGLGINARASIRESVASGQPRTLVEARQRLKDARSLYETLHPSNFGADDSKMSAEEFIEQLRQEAKIINEDCRGPLGTCFYAKAAMASSKVKQAEIMIDRESGRKLIEDLELNVKNLSKSSKEVHR